MRDKSAVCTGISKYEGPEAKNKCLKSIMIEITVLREL